MLFKSGKAGEDFIAPIVDCPVTAIWLRCRYIQINSADSQMERLHIRAVHILQFELVAQFQAVQISKVTAYHALAGSRKQSALIEFTQSQSKIFHHGII